MPRLLSYKIMPAWLFIMALFVSESVMATPREDAIKSGFLYNFARYSEGTWFNPTLDDRYTICSFDIQFVNVATQTLKDRTINGVPVVVLLLTSEFEDLSHCNTLFISKNGINKWPSLIENHSLLTAELMLVGEFDDFITSGGHINFFIVAGKVRFEVNTLRLKESGIDMSSKVLRLARTNKGEE